MPTARIKLTKTPVRVSFANLPAYVQSHNNHFRFAFSETQPADLTAYHEDKKVYTDGGLGALWVWLAHEDEAYVSVST